MDSTKRANRRNDHTTVTFLILFDSIIVVVVFVVIAVVIAARHRDKNGPLRHDHPKHLPCFTLMRTLMLMLMLTFTSCEFAALNVQSDQNHLSSIRNGKRG